MKKIFVLLVICTGILFFQPAMIAGTLASLMSATIIGMIMA